MNFKEKKSIVEERMNLSFSSAITSPTFSTYDKASVDSKNGSFQRSNPPQLARLMCAKIRLVQDRAAGGKAL